ncbi:hypothetical protein PALB_10910 [Pseudoalteromonas luteoviolacea B = ATCC 29581]|nr:hypothetical protein PALB_10910 [Pseudoalteromonas luteoviolacea B = ATCC 29581]
MGAEGRILRAIAQNTADHIGNLPNGLHILAEHASWGNEAIG